MLGWMLIHAPSPEGCTYLADRINCCQDDGKVVELGKHYIDRFVNYCAYKSFSPVPS